MSDNGYSHHLSDAPLHVLRLPLLADAGRGAARELALLEELAHAGRDHGRRDQQRANDAEPSGQLLAGKIER